MKTSAVFAAVAAVVASVSVGLGAFAQNDPQSRPAPPPAAPAAAPAPAAAAPATPPASADAGKAADAKLTKEESEAAETVILGKCTKCHGTEVIISQHLGKTEWQSVLDDMGPSAELTKAETTLVLRYLVENLGPVAKP